MAVTRKAILNELTRIRVTAPNCVAVLKKAQFLDTRVVDPTTLASEDIFQELRSDIIKFLSESAPLFAYYQNFYEVVEQLHEDKEFAFRAIEEHEDQSLELERKYTATLYSTAQAIINKLPRASTEAESNFVEYVRRGVNAFEDIKNALKVLSFAQTSFEDVAPSEFCTMSRGAY